MGGMLDAVNAVNDTVGVDGTVGADGTVGQDGTESCSSHHNDANNMEQDRQDKSNNCSKTDGGTDSGGDDDSDDSERSARDDDNVDSSVDSSDSSDVSSDSSDDSSDSSDESPYVSESESGSSIWSESESSDESSYETLGGSSSHSSDGSDSSDDFDDSHSSDARVDERSDSSSLGSRSHVSHASRHSNRSDNLSRSSNGGSANSKYEMKVPMTSSVPSVAPVAPTSVPDTSNTSNADSPTSPISPNSPASTISPISSPQSQSSFSRHAHTTRSTTYSTSHSTHSNYSTHSNHSTNNRSTFHSEVLPIRTHGLLSYNSNYHTNHTNHPSNDKSSNSSVPSFPPPQSSSPSKSKRNGNDENWNPNPSSVLIHRRRNAPNESSKFNSNLNSDNQHDSWIKHNPHEEHKGHDQDHEMHMDPDEVNDVNETWKDPFGSRNKKSHTRDGRDGRDGRDERIERVDRVDRRRYKSDNDGKAGKAEKHYKTKKKSKKSHLSKSKSRNKRQGLHRLQRLCWWLHSKKRSTQLLTLVFVLWMGAQFYYFYYFHLVDYLATSEKGEYGFIADFVDLFGGLLGERNGKFRRRGRRSPRNHGNQRNPLPEEGWEFQSPNQLQRLRQEARQALGSGAGDLYYEEDTDGQYVDGGKPNKKKLKQKYRGGSGDSNSNGGRKGVERLKKGCSELEWHSYHFPNCNEIHEVDLRGVVRGVRGNFDGLGWMHGVHGQGMVSEVGDEMDVNDISGHFNRPKFRSFRDYDWKEDHRRAHRRRHQHHEDTSQINSNGTETSFEFPWGFVGNGLWRDVFSCDPHGETTSTISSDIHINFTHSVSSAYASSTFSMDPPAVLKIMKSQHPYDHRNFQRHRRDALVMERLSSSSFIPSIYGYCANTVLTQAISHTLDDVIYAREKERIKYWSPRGGYVTQPKIETWMGREEYSGELLATRETEVGRVQLALGVFRGLVDLHEGRNAGTKEGGEWLPVVHADLQSKQYLVDAETGQIYLNDFNRCRFLTKKDPPKVEESFGLDVAEENVEQKDVGSQNNDNNQTNSLPIRPPNSSKLTPQNTTNDSSSKFNDPQLKTQNQTQPLQACPLYIPTAPGASRSPEEYDMAPLSEKLDVYSAGNVLYGIITGKRPWNDEKGKGIKMAIQRGDRPEVPDDIRNGESGWVDMELVRILDLVYEGDPTKRASAKEVVSELESILEKLKREEKSRFMVMGTMNEIDKMDERDSSHGLNVQEQRVNDNVDVEDGDDKKLEKKHVENEVIEDIRVQVPPVRLRRTL